MNLPKKALIIFVTGGSWSEHARIEPFAPEDNVDVAFAFWGEAIYSDPMWKSAKYVHKQKGMKFHLLRDMFRNHPEIKTDYDAVFVFDDDVYMSKEAILDFLKIFYLFDFGIAAPAFYKNPTNPKFGYKPGYFYRTTNMVDITAWCMSKKALAATIPIIETSDFGHGWGIPEWWMVKYHERNGKTIDGQRIGIIDATPAEHTREVNSQMRKLGEEFGGTPRDEYNRQVKRHIGYSPEEQWFKIVKVFEKVTRESFAKAVKNADK
jgi:hypothetical protein